MIPIGKINFSQINFPGNTPDIPGFGQPFGIPGGPGAEQMPPGIAAGIDAKRPALGQPGFDTIFGGQKILPTASVSPDPYKNYNVADAYKQSDFYDNSMNSQGYLDFLENARNNFMTRDMQQDMKSAAYNDARGKIFDAYDTFNPITNTAEQEAHYAANPGIAAFLQNERKYDDGFFADPTGQQLLGPDGNPMQPFIGDTSPVGGPVRHFGPSAMPTDNFADNTDFFNNMHSSGQQPTGGFDSKAFANELLTGIGDLFKQHFPESAQMAFNNSNQPQSQIEQPIQDATTFDVQPQQNMAFNPFSVNTLGGSFGGGY